MPSAGPCLAAVDACHKCAALVLGSDVQSAEISYGFNQSLESNQWIDVECVTGEPVATFDNGRLHVVCE